MKYRNTRTGTVFESIVKIGGGDWMEEPAKVSRSAPESTKTESAAKKVTRKTKK